MNEAKNCTIWKLHGNMQFTCRFILLKFLLRFLGALLLCLHGCSRIGDCVTCYEMFLTACRAGTLYARSGARCGAQSR